MLEDTTWVIRNRNSKKGRQFNDQKKRNKDTNNNIHYKVSWQVAINPRTVDI